MEHRRSWAVTLDGVDRQIVVVYAALSGWMSIEVDGARCARGWREVQTVIGGANLSCDVGGHRVDARITQPFGKQDYSFAVRVDGELQPGSDPQPEPSALKRQTLKAFGLLMVTIFLITAVTTVVRSVNSPMVGRRRVVRFGIMTPYSPTPLPRGQSNGG